MARGDKSKAERREARSAGGATKAERKQARASGGGTKAERRQARKGGDLAGGGAGPDAPAEDASAEERIEWRLAHIEEAVAAQSQRSDELLTRVNELLEGSSESSGATDGS
jgi:hypothetical protein